MAEQTLELKLIFDNAGALKSVEELTGAVQKNEDATRKAGEGLSGVLDNLKKRWLQIAVGVGGAIVAFKQVIGIAGGFEDAINKVAAASGEASDALAEMARTASKETGASATKAAEAMLSLANAGFKSADMAQALGPVLRLVQASGIGAADAAEAVAVQLKIFGGSARDAAEYVDVLAKNARTSGTSFQQILDALTPAANIAKQAGISFRDLNALIGAMAERGIKGARAGLELKTSIDNLVNPTKSALDALSKYGISADELAKLLPRPVDLFKRLKDAGISQADALTVLGSRSTTLFSIIKDGVPDLQRLEGALGSAGGAAQEAASRQMASLEGAMTRLKAAFELAVVGGTEGLVPMMKAVVGVATQALKGFAAMPGPVQALTVAIGVLTPAFVGLLAVLSPTQLLIAGLAAAIGLLLPAAFAQGSATDQLEAATSRLAKTTADYSDVVGKLNDPTKKLTSSEREMLLVRKDLLELDMEKQVYSLLEARRKLQAETQAATDDERRFRGEQAKGRAQMVEAQADLKRLTAQKSLDGKETAELVRKYVGLGDGVEDTLRRAADSQKKLAELPKAQLDQTIAGVGTLRAVLEGGLARGMRLVEAAQDSMREAIEKGGKAYDQAGTKAIAAKDKLAGAARAEAAIVDLVAQTSDKETRSKLLSLIADDDLRRSVEAKVRSYDSEVQALSAKSAAEADAAQKTSLTASQQKKIQEDLAAFTRAQETGVASTKFASLNKMLDDVKKYGTAVTAEGQSQADAIKLLNAAIATANTEAIQKEVDDRVKAVRDGTAQIGAVEDELLARYAANAEARKIIDKGVMEERQRQALEWLGNAKAVEDAAGSNVEAWHERRTAIIQTEQQEQLNALYARLQAGEITEQQFADSKVAIDKEAQKRIADANRKKAIFDKVLGVANAGIAVAEAIVKSLGTPWMIPIIAALGAAQIAAIVATPIPPLPAFREGGQIPGYGGGDRIPIMAEAGEFVVNKQSAAAFLPALEAINGARMAAGGAVGSAASSTTTSHDNRKTEFHFHGITDLRAARNELLRREGSGAF